MDHQIKRYRFAVMERRLGNGADILIWHNNWLKGGKHLNSVNTVPVITLTWCISDIEAGTVWHMTAASLEQNSATSCT